jgi:uncharacterized DUF497 family protein
MQVEWNPEKAKSNLQKHGVSFSDAEAVLFDPYSGFRLSEIQSNVLYRETE